MDENDVKAIRRGVVRGLSQYLIAEGEPPIELLLLLHRLQKGEAEPEGQSSLFSESEDDKRK